MFGNVDYSGLPAPEPELPAAAADRPSTAACRSQEIAENPNPNPSPNPNPNPNPTQVSQQKAEVDEVKGKTLEEISQVAEEIEP